MLSGLDINERHRLLAELSLRQRSFVETAHSLLALARDPNRREGALVEARFHLGRAIRLRRATVEQIFARSNRDLVCIAAASTARAAKQQLHDRALERLGHWSAARMEAEPEALAAEMERYLPGLIALTERETAAAIRYLDGLAPAAADPLPPLAAAR